MSLISFLNSAFRTLCKDFRITELPHICIFDQVGRMVDREHLEFRRILHILESIHCIDRLQENDEEMKQKISNANKLFEDGCYLEAAQSFSHLFFRWKMSSQISFNFGVTLQNLDEHYFSIPYMMRVIKMDDEDSVAHNVLKSICHSIEPQAVIRAYENIVQECPHHVHAAHWLASLTNTAKTASPEYVQNVFDQLADTFDDKLVNHLEYRVPWLLVDVLLKHEPKVASQKLCILDVGCGTGLCGKLLRRFASRLIGVCFMEIGCLDID